MRRFTLTAQHVALLKRMYVEWSDSAYYGAPAVNIKRPYGNGGVWEDVAEILGIEQIEGDEGESVWPKGTKAQCLALHEQTADALQVCLSAQSFEPGDYEADDYLNNWRRKS